MRLIDVKNGETFKAYLAETGNGFSIFIARPGACLEWRGAAAFPLNLYGEAVARFKDLETDVDVEDVLREWGDPDGTTLSNFIAFMGEDDVALTFGCDASGRGLGEDLPDVVVQPRAQRIAKKRRELRQKKKEEKYPYAPRKFPTPDDASEDEVRMLPLEEYDHIIVSFSGGKDSIACVLHLLEMGVPASRIELWHQCVDGRPGRDQRVYDWPCTESYCQAFADAFNLKLLFQWKERGFIGEMFRRNQPTAPTTFQTVDGRETTVGGTSDPGTRLVWPAMSAALTTRWCSAYLKIDVARKTFTNDPRFHGSKSLMITGERRQESGNRARYASVIDAGSAPTKRRVVHQWRAVLSWFEQDVWEIMERFKIRPHPAYHLGWSRVSCLPCIFGDSDQWASVQHVAPKLFDRLAALEDKFHAASMTLPDHPWSRENQLRRYMASENKPAAFQYKHYDGYLRAGESLPEAAARGASYITPDVAPWLQVAMSEHYPSHLVTVKAGEKWVLPKGAYGHSGGPT